MVRRLTYLRVLNCIHSIQCIILKIRCVISVFVWLQSNLSFCRPMACKSERVIVKKMHQTNQEQLDEIREFLQERVEQDQAKRKRRSGKSNWANFNAQRRDIRAKELKKMQGIPDRRLSTKTTVMPRRSRALQTGVRRVNSFESSHPTCTVTVSKGTQTG